MLWFIDGLTVSGSCIICALLGRHIDRPSVDVSVYYDILTEKRPMCRLIYWPTYWLYWSVECRLICRPIIVVQLSAELWIDSLLTFHQYTTSLILEYLVDCSPCCSVNSLYVRNACGGAAQISLFYPLLLSGFFVLIVVCHCPKLGAVTSLQLQTKFSSFK